MDQKAHSAGMLSSEVMGLVMHEPDPAIVVTALMSALSIVVNAAALNHDSTVDAFRNALAEAKRRMVSMKEH